MTNHPTQGLQDMTLDLSTYDLDGLADLATRIEAEKTKRERKVPFVVQISEFHNACSVRCFKGNEHFLTNLYHRLSAEAKLRAAGGGAHTSKRGYFIIKNGRDVGDASSTMLPYQGVIYFESKEKALSAWHTLTPDEQAAIFGFGEG